MIATLQLYATDAGFGGTMIRHIIHDKNKTYSISEYGLLFNAIIHISNNYRKNILFILRYDVGKTVYWEI